MSFTDTLPRGNQDIKRFINKNKKAKTFFYKNRHCSASQEGTGRLGNQSRGTCHFVYYAYLLWSLLLTWSVEARHDEPQCSGHTIFLQALGFMRHPLFFAIKFSTVTNSVTTTTSVSMLYYARAWAKSGQVLRPKHAATLFYTSPLLRCSYFQRKFWIH